MKLKLCIISFCFLFVIDSMQQQVVAQSRPNVLLIIADDLNIRLGYYGWPVSTPNIDRLASIGRPFMNAYCQYPLCNPSRASFMSGLRPDRTGIYNNSQNERILGAIWLNEWFKSREYRTARFGKVYHHPQYFTNWTYQSDSKDDLFTCLETGKPGSWCSQSIIDAQTQDGKNVNKAASWIQTNREFSWMCCVGLTRPHTLHAPSSYYGLYAASAIQLSPDPANDLNDVPVEAYSNNFPLAVSDFDARLSIRAYYASVSFVDAQIGILLAKLDQLQLWNKTIVVIFGDHGFLLGDHAGIWGGRVLFDWATRVPFIIVIPNQILPGQSTVKYAELTALFPTLTDLCNLSTPIGLDGLSLKPLINDPNSIVYTEVLSYLKVKEFPLSNSIVTNNFRSSLWSQGGIELYDLLQDPRENVNLAVP